MDVRRKVFTLLGIILKKDYFTIFDFRKCFSVLLPTLGLGLVFIKRFEPNPGTESMEN